jgi:hypothetical protein
VVTSLVEFLLARIAEDEEVARAASVRRYDFMTFADHILSVERDSTDAMDEHVARWDPARVIAECDARRRIVESARHTLFDDPLRRTDFWRGARDVADADLRFLALPYADHPDYDPAWRP